MALQNKHFSGDKDFVRFAELTGGSLGIAGPSDPGPLGGALPIHSVAVTRHKKAPAAKEHKAATNHAIYPHLGVQVSQGGNIVGGPGFNHHKFDMLARDIQLPMPEKMRPVGPTGKASKNSKYMRGTFNDGHSRMHPGGQMKHLVHQHLARIHAQTLLGHGTGGAEHPSMQK